jgi:AbrB family looped-hinge helix DNA binding protein
MGTRMTSKGQVTIPKAVRQHLGVGPGSEIEFELEPDGRVLVASAQRKKRPRPQMRLPSRFGAIVGTVKSDMTTDEIMKLLRGDR